MRTITLILFILFFQLNSYSQPSAATVQKDVKNDLGANCLSVKVGGGGSTATEYVNGGYSTFYRVSVSAIFKTDLPGVTKIAKGAAKYRHAGGGKYAYVQYAFGTVEFLGMPAPDTSVIRALILSKSDYGLTQASFLDDVISFKFLQTPAPLWNTILSFEIPVDLTYIKRNSSVEIETIKEPFSLRVYRKSATEPWTDVAWSTPDHRFDKRLKQSLGVEAIGEYKISKMTYWFEKNKIKEAEKIAGAMPIVEIPTVNNIKDVFKWYHGLLMEGDYAKVEAAIIQLLHPDLIDSRTKLLDANAVLMLDRMKKVLTNDFSTYKKQYCTTPVLFEVSDTEIYWWNKDKTQKSSITIKKENNRWYIYNVASYLWTFYNEAQANVTMNTACK